jgi:hypothetical protein
LRDNFVLYWSSERPVPRVTIDFGDGRKIVRTTTGNSAHYVMNAKGAVLDVVPGLYAPAVFQSELAKSLALAKQVEGLENVALVDAVMAYHEAAIKTTDTQLTAVAGTDYIRRRGRLLGASEIGTYAVATAQMATMAKSYVEVPDLQKIGVDAGRIDKSDLEQWTAIGQKVWNIGLGPPPEPTGPANNRARLRRTNTAQAATPVVLDRASLALIEKVRTGNPLAADPSWLVARLEQLIVADTALNQFQLRTRIRRNMIAGHTLDFATVNDEIYAEAFSTPKADPWLGLLTHSDFTGLPADGVVTP